MSDIPLSLTGFQCKIQYIISTQYVTTSVTENLYKLQFTSAQVFVIIDTYLIIPKEADIMNPFQKLLNEYIDAKDITIYALAKISGIERSFVQKIKNGSRIPTDENIESFSMAIASDTLDVYTFSRYTKDESHDDDVYGFWKLQ